MMIIDCSANNQLLIQIFQLEMPTKKALAQLKPERRKSVLLGIRAFYSTSVHIFTVSSPSSEHSLESNRDV